jgi:hypothetical protein
MIFDALLYRLLVIGEAVVRRRLERVLGATLVAPSLDLAAATRWAQRRRHPL